ncbi:MAG: hypothetical protein WBW33_07145 [Bryobacteraceae bacterium]
MPTTFTIPKEFTVDGVEIDLGASAPSAAVLNAIATDTPFPTGDITAGSLSVSASTGNPVKLGDASKNVSFSFSGSANYSISVFSDPKTVAQTLNANSNIASGIDLTTGTATTDRFAVLQLTYDLGATVKGAVAFGAGATLNFGVTGSLQGDWDVVHRFPAGTGAFDALADTFSAWRLPRQIRSAGQLPPGAWIVTELNGSLKANVGVQAGYDYTWVKQLGGNLNGDIGLKVSLAASAALGFSANGSYALALSRQDHSNKLRLAAYKLNKLGFDFALNASAGVQGILPASQQSTDVTDLIKAIFGVNATQLINDLKLVQKVAAGGKLTDHAASYLVSLGQTKIPGVGDAIAEFNAGVDAANNFISQLGSLGSRTTAHLLSLLPKAAADVAEFTTILGQIQTAAADPTQIGRIVLAQLGKVAFFQTPFVQWLSSYLQDSSVASPLAALADNSILQSIGTAATTTLNLLNGGDMQTLINFAAKNLDLQNIPDLQHIDKWLVSKFAAFLNKAVPSVAQQDLTNVQNAINNLFTKADQFLAEAIKAAQKKYEMTFVATYENATTDTALLDVVFDFDANPALGPFLESAIDGDFTQILIDPTIQGVTLNAGVLTHGYHSQTHVEFTMPFLDLGTTAATNVLSKLTVKNDNGGRVLAYTVQGNNDVQSFVAGKVSRDSQMTLAISMNFPASVNKAADFKSSMGYALRAAYHDLPTQTLIEMLPPLITTYSLPLPVSDVASWAIDFDKVTEQVSSGHLGESLVALDVAVNPDLLGIWLQAPTNAKDQAYFALSTSIQGQLRNLIPTVYFSQLARYDEVQTAYPMLLYSALRRINSFDIADDQTTIVPTQDGVYWAFSDGEHLSPLAFDPDTQSRLLTAVRNAHGVLSNARLSSAGSYTDDAINSIMSAALQTSPSFKLPQFMGPLIVFEAQFIGAIVSAATNLAKAASTGGTNPTAALKAMATFAADIVGPFNQALGDGVFDGPELQLLGSALFTEVSLAMATAIRFGGVVPANTSPSALYSVTVLAPGSGVSLDNLRQGNFQPAQVLVEQKLASPLAQLAQAGVLAVGVGAP